MNKDSLRKLLRQKRIFISQHEQETASLAIKQLFCTSPEFIHSQYIAGYWPILGEINSILILEEAIKQNKKCYLPIIPDQPDVKRADEADQRKQHLSYKVLSFVEYTAKEPLILNAYGILEPAYHKNKVISINDLDIVMAPLLGFDQEGTRLGMGKGFYDRTFAFLNEGKDMPKPRLIGLAYAWQEVAEIPKEKHDVLLSGVITDKRFIRFEYLSGSP
jgi:5-formyltetrahydrofolate cyclo-ligase